MDQLIIILFAFLAGLCIGSFVNVVVYRLPLAAEKQMTLLSPASQCMKCGTPIKPWHNIPLIGFFVLGGRCASCNSRISLVYPLIELVTALLFVAIFIQFGLSLKSLYFACFTGFLLALSVIDFKHYILPDKLTLPLLWIGLLVNTGGVFTDLKSAVFGAVGGYAILWLVYQLYKVTRNKEAMGYGDFKLLAALGAWAGWQALPLIILLASVSGLIFGGVALLLGKGQKIAFGPFLSLAGCLILYFNLSDLDHIISILN